MTTFPYELETNTPTTMGLVVLQTDQRIEADMRILLDQNTDLNVTRIPSGATVTNDTLSQMEQDLPMATALLPRAAQYDVVGYGCTSGTSVIGAERIAELVKSNCTTAHVTEPVSALIAACRHLNVKRIGFLSPYVEQVSQTLRDTLAGADIETPVFGSFEEESEEWVVRISLDSTYNAALDLDADQLDAIFLSCTNLNTLPIIPKLEEALEKPVLSSNLVLAWHMQRLAGHAITNPSLGQLFGGAG